MSFWIILIIMLFSGTIGGIVNYLLPANNTEPGKYIKPLGNCLVLGLGATVLVPLFLEIAQSKLLDDINFGWEWKSDSAEAASGPIKREIIRITDVYDTLQKKIIKSDTLHSGKIDPASNSANVRNSNKENTGKNYLLWAAYCLVAASAGFKFINMVVNNVVKDQQVTKLKNENQDLKKDKVKREENSQIRQKKEDKIVRQELANQALSDLKGTDKNVLALENIEIPIIPQLPPVIYPEDPQKGRFGGKSENNERRLSAKVKASAIPKFYKVELIVESTNPANPLNTDVIFYLHDSFSPSVYPIKPDEFTEGKAYDNEILSYGAFTVGIITDNGKTMLELDLAELKDAPKEFRER